MGKREVDGAGAELPVAVAAPRQAGAGHQQQHGVGEPARNKRDARGKPGTLLGPHLNEVRRGRVLFIRRLVVAAADPNAVLRVGSHGVAAAAGYHGNRRGCWKTCDTNS